MSGETRFLNPVTGESYTHDLSVPLDPIHTVANQSHNGTAWTGKADKVITSGPLDGYNRTTLDPRIRMNKLIRNVRYRKFADAINPDILAAHLHENHGKTFAQKQKEVTFNRTKPLQYSHAPGGKTHGWVTAGPPFHDYGRSINHGH